MQSNQFENESQERLDTKQELHRILDEFIAEIAEIASPMQILEEYKKFLLAPKTYLGSLGYRIRRLDERIREAANSFSIEQESLLILHLINSRITALRNEIQKKSKQRNLDRPRAGRTNKEQ